METRRCNLCSKAAGQDVFHDLSEFGSNARTSDGIAHDCRKSHNAYMHGRKEIREQEARIRRIDIPPRPDRVFKGRPGRPIKVVSTKLKHWSW